MFFPNPSQCQNTYLILFFFITCIPHNSHIIFNITRQLLKENQKKILKTYFKDFNMRSHNSHNSGSGNALSCTKANSKLGFDYFTQKANQFFEHSS
jgi:hypothetical protein